MTVFTFVFKFFYSVACGNVDEGTSQEEMPDSTWIRPRSPVRPFPEPSNIGHFYEISSDDGNVMDDSDDSNQSDKCLSDSLSREDLKKWAINHKVTHACLTELLRLLHKPHPNLPRDARTLLETDRNACEKIKTMGEGDFAYFQSCKDIFDDPILSSELGIFASSNLSSKFSFCPLSSIVRKYVCFSHKKRFVLIPLLHSHLWISFYDNCCMIVQNKIHFMAYLYFAYHIHVVQIWYLRSVCKFDHLIDMILLSLWHHETNWMLSGQLGLFLD